MLRRAFGEVSREWEYVDVSTKLGELLDTTATTIKPIGNVLCVEVVAGY